jgi:hypothetical protein
MSRLLDTPIVRALALGQPLPVFDAFLLCHWNSLSIL